MVARVFIDGEAGTTGLQIRERLAMRRDLELISIPDESRKDPAARADYLNKADIAILCLPDAAAKESVALIENDTTRVIDASSAHRVAEGWAYGFAEMDLDQADIIAAAMRVANPGCWPQGLIAAVRPAVKAIVQHIGLGRQQVVARHHPVLGRLPLHVEGLVLRRQLLKQRFEVA